MKLAQNDQEAVDRVTSAAIIKEDYQYDPILVDSEMPAMNEPIATTEIRRVRCWHTRQCTAGTRGSLQGLWSK